MFSMKLITTNADGDIVTEENISSIIKNFSIEETVGDEFFIKAGDISFKSTEQIIAHSFPQGNDKWITIYWNGSLYSAYYLSGYEKYDYKNDLYHYRLPSVQNKFFNDLKATPIIYEGSNSEIWSYGLISAKVVIAEIKFDLSGTPATALNRWGFSLGDMILNFLSKSNDYGYTIHSISLPSPVMTQDNLPILYRGISYDTGQPEQTAVEGTFQDYEVTWNDILQFMVFAFNCFIRAKPSITGSPQQFGIDLLLKPKINISATGGGTVTWLEKIYQPNRFKIDGIHLSGLNFEYTQGIKKGGNVFERNIDISDPEVITNDDQTLFWSVGDYNSGITKYEILDGSDNPRPYFSSGLVEPYYANMISAGDSYEGQILFNAQKVLDEIDVGIDTFQLNRLQIDDDGIANIEGIVLP